MEILIPITLFIMIAAIVIAPRWFKSQERQKLQETLRASIEKGAPIPPEVIEAMTSNVKAPPSPYRDLRAGIVWLGVAVGFTALGFAVSFEEPDALYPLLGIAAFPGFIGLALIALSFVTRGKN